MNILKNTLSEQLQKKDGIWFSNTTSSISYPEDGNKNCFEIEDNSFWFKHRNNCILELVKKYAHKPIFFDIGGGNGFTSLYLQRNNIETVLVEPGKGVFNAKKRGLTQLICSTFNDAGFTNNSIPNIGLFDVLEHIEKDRNFLLEIYKKLEPQGKIFITVPAYSFLWSNDDIVARHFRRYSLKRMTNLLQDSGFEIKYASYFFSILLFPIFLFRTLPSLFTKKQKQVDEYKKEHSAKKSESLLEKIWKFEINRIKQNKKIYFGSSCIIVAKKQNL